MLTIFLLLTSFLSISIKCACPSGQFTINSPCDTRATPLECREYVSERVPPDGWRYFYLAFDGTEGIIELEFKTYTSKTTAYYEVQPPDESKLPDMSSKSYLQLRLGEVMKENIPTRGKTGNLVIGIKNDHASIATAGVGIRYFTTERNCKRQIALKIIIGVSVGVGATFLAVGFAVFKLKYMSRRLARERESRQNSEAQPSYSSNRSATTVIKAPQSDLLSTEEIQEYFPKTNFETLKNPFLQTTCTVCLEEFSQDTSCRQLYCHHIFHEICVQGWLTKHNNCPGCRVPMTKKAIKDFIEAKALEKEKATIQEQLGQERPKEFENSSAGHQVELVIGDDEPLETGKEA